MTTEPKTIDLVCIGVRETGKGKLIPAFAEFNGGTFETVTEPRAYAWEGVKAMPGHIYRFKIGRWGGEHHEVTVAADGRPLYVGVWPNEEHRLRWHAESDAKKNTKRAEKIRDDAEKTREVVVATEKLARAYARMDYGSRTAFLIQIQQLVVHHPNVK